MATLTLLIALIIVALVAVAIVGSIIWALVATRKPRARRDEALSILGFHPVASPPAALRDALASLQRGTKGSSPAIRRLHRRTTPVGALYLLGIESNDGGRIWLGDDTLAALVPGLAAPSLVLLPGALQASGSLAQVTLERVLDLIGGMSGLARIDYEDDIEFNERFLVIGDDEDKARAFLTDARRTALLELPPAVAFTTAGDLIALSPYPPNSAPKGQTASLRALSDAAERLLAAVPSSPN